MDLGTVIKNIRKQKNLTQKTLAKKCKITQTYLSQIEGNHKEPNLSKLKTIGKVLNVPLPILFFLSLTEDDVPKHKRENFTLISPSVKSFINEYFAV